MSDEFAHIYHDLEKGVNPLAYHYPYLPIPAFKNVTVLALVFSSWLRHHTAAQTASRKTHRHFQTLIDSHYKDGTKLTDNEITGMLLGAIFAGHTPAPVPQHGCCWKCSSNQPSCATYEKKLRIYWGRMVR